MTRRIFNYGRIAALLLFGSCFGLGIGAAPAAAGGWGCGYGGGCYAPAPVIVQPSCSCCGCGGGGYGYGYGGYGGYGGYAAMAMAMLPPTRHMLPSMMRSWLHPGTTDRIADVMAGAGADTALSAGCVT